MSITIEYNQELFRSRDIRKCGEAYLKVLPSNITGLLSRGSSGCSIAAAMLTLYPHILIHTAIRKKHENAHFPWGGLQPNSTLIYAIVDDFISGGHTVDCIFEFVKQEKLNVEVILVNHCPESLLHKWLPIRVIEVE